MIKETGTATSADDLRSKLKTFLQAQSITLHDSYATAETAVDVYLIGGKYFYLESANDVDPSANFTTFNGLETLTVGMCDTHTTGNRIFEQTDSRQQKTYTDGALVASSLFSNPLYSALCSNAITYHAYADANAVHIVIEVLPGEYQHLSFGQATTLTDATHYVTGSMTIDGFSYETDLSTTADANSLPLFYQNVAAATADAYNHSSYRFTVAPGFNLISITGDLYKALNASGLVSSMLPIHLGPPGYGTVTGQTGSLRFVNFAGRLPGSQIIDSDSSTWDLWPFYSHTTENYANREFSGIAIKVD